MNWNTIVSEIAKAISSQGGLKDSLLKTGALKTIAEIMSKNFPEYVSNPSLLKQVNIGDFKKLITEKNGGNLNEAANSVINWIYNLVEDGKIKQ